MSKLKLPKVVRPSINGYFHKLVKNMACPSVERVSIQLDKVLEDCNYHHVEEFKDFLQILFHKDLLEEVKKQQERIKYLESLCDLQD